MTEQAKLIVASSRLPVTVSRDEGRWSASTGAGGLVTALRPVAQRTGFEWIGWPGVGVEQDQQAAVRDVLAEAARSNTDGLGWQLTPLFLSPADVHGFYSGFSNAVLWPLFHGFTNRSAFSVEDYEGYVRANRRFAELIAERAAPTDLIWIHDYQLMLVPAMLRELGLTNPIGFFLHIPFPSSEAYRTLPVRQELLDGLLGADLLAFHAYEYLSHFCKSCLRVLGLDSDSDCVRTRARKVRLGVLPIGIDPDELRQLMQTPAAVAEFESLTQSYAGKKLILGVDRLDYTKGLVEKLLAYEDLLRNHPRWSREAVLIQVAAPSRMSVDEYQQLKRQVDELVGRINGKYGSSDHTPIVYINQNIDRDRIVGMYRAADVALVTPVRDGMNLVALEYVAARGPAGGHLILSEFTGAAYQLPEARLVNPYNVREVSVALNAALESEPPESKYMQEFVETNTAMRWADQFVARLEECRTNASPPRRLKAKHLIERFAGRQQLGFFLDYDGTLRGFEVNPRYAAPGERVRELLRTLSTLGHVFVISGRDEQTLESWLGDLPVGLVCEHGYAIRERGRLWEHRVEVDPNLLGRVRTVLDEFVRRTPGSRVELKRSALAWHYRSVDAELGAFQSKELVNELAELLKREPYSILRGNKVVEVRHTSCTKGRAVEQLLRKNLGIDGIFCAGDDNTDEEMMEFVRTLETKATALCWVGGGSAIADFWVNDSTALINELQSFAAARGALKASA
jgi:trehalose 6-phosphate synthase/phosphatase